MAQIYGEQNTLTLRQEALNRVREMQRRAQAMTETQSRAGGQWDGGAAAGAKISHDENSGVEAATLKRGPNVESSQPALNFSGRQPGTRQQSGMGKNALKDGITELLKRQGLGDRIGGLGETVQNTVSSISQPAAQLLQSFGIDGEKLIILMVMWTVFNQDKENKTLLMALGYLLL